MKTGWRTRKRNTGEWNRIFTVNVSVFTWHEETFNLSKGSTLIIPGYPVNTKAFRFGSRPLWIIGLIGDTPRLLRNGSGEIFSGRESS